MPPRRRVVSRTRVAGTAPATADNRRQRYRDLRQAVIYLESGGFSLRSPQDRPIFSIWRVRYSAPVHSAPVRRWDALSPSYRRRLLGSRALREAARNAKLSVPEYYEIAADLRAARGHRGPGAFPGPAELEGNVFYEVYIAQEYERLPGAALTRSGKLAATSRRTKRAWRTTNTRRGRPQAVGVRMMSLSEALGLAGGAAGAGVEAGESGAELGEEALWDDEW